MSLGARVDPLSFIIIAAVNKNHDFWTGFRVRVGWGETQQSINTKRDFFEKPRLPSQHKQIIKKEHKINYFNVPTQKAMTNHWKLNYFIGPKQKVMTNQ